MLWFQSTHSPYGVTLTLPWVCNLLQYFNPLSIQRVTALVNSFSIGTNISIHTLHTESDDQLAKPLASIIDFNPHSPYREWLLLKCTRVSKVLISIHTLHTESDASWMAGHVAWLHISIHTLHTESDVHWTTPLSCLLIFQSTLSIQRVTRYYFFHDWHAYNFNPHSPYREWLINDKNNSETY